ncbi:MAG: RagB/SusD family nutrient uptake outer membrane protein, partial [Bacteroidales bacterium]
EAINGNLPNSTSLPANEYGRVTIAAAKGMMMKLYLYYEGYGKTVLGFSDNLKTNDGTEITLQMVQGFADDIIGSGDYQLVPQFSNLWGVANEVNSEFIFQVRFSELRDWGDWGARNYSEGNWAAIMYGFRIQSDDVYAEGWSFAPVSQNLVDMYAENDTRKAASFVHESEIESLTEGYQHTGYAFKKFHPTIADDPITANRMLNQPFDRPDLRLADVLLMGAELYLNTDMGKARQYFNAVHQRATGSEYAGDLSLEVIFDERRKEFAGEGQRYFDLMRRGTDYMAQKLGEIDLGGDFSINFDPTRKGLLPIPQREINLNPNFQQFVY